MAVLAAAELLDIAGPVALAEIMAILVAQQEEMALAEEAVVAAADTITPTFFLPALGSIGPGPVAVA